MHPGVLIGIKHMIQEFRRNGQVPVELHGTKRTINELAALANLKPEIPPDTRSPLQRMLNRVPAPEACLKYCGLKLVVNPRLPEDALIVRPQEAMGNPDWITPEAIEQIRRGVDGNAVGSAAQPVPPEDGSTPWMQKAPPDAVEREGVLGELNRVSGLSPTSVLMKAMEDIDRIEHVIVIRFRNTGDVDMASTMNRLEIRGGLDKALMYLMRGE